MQEVEAKLAQVQRGECPTPVDDLGAPIPLASWEQKQASLRTVQQRTCNPAKFFGQANEQCPAAFAAHWPCSPERLDFEQCKSGHHKVCDDLTLLRATFLCEQVPKREGINYVLHGQADIGVWGGSCTCPNGGVYQVGDHADMCGTLACTGGVAGTCNKEVDSAWAFRSVECAQIPSPMAPPLLPPLPAAPPVPPPSSPPIPCIPLSPIPPPPTPPPPLPPPPTSLAELLAAASATASESATGPSVPSFGDDDARTGGARISPQIEHGGIGLRGGGREHVDRRQPQHLQGAADVVIATQRGGEVLPTASRGAGGDSTESEESGVFLIAAVIFRVSGIVVLLVYCWSTLSNGRSHRGFSTVGDKRPVLIGRLPHWLRRFSSPPWGAADDDDESDGALDGGVDASLARALESVEGVGGMEVADMEFVEGDTVIEVADSEFEHASETDVARDACNGPIPLASASQSVCETALQREDDIQTAIDVEEDRTVIQAGEDRTVIQAALAGRNEGGDAWRGAGGSDRSLLALDPSHTLHHYTPTREQSVHESATGRYRGATFPANNTPAAPKWSQRGGMWQHQQPS